MRMTENKRRILEALRGSMDDDFIEHGPPPYSAVDVTLMIGGDVRNTARTLRNMAQQGLVVPEECLREQWSEVPKPGHYERLVACYWNASTREEDARRVRAWNDAAPARRQKAMEAFARLIAGSRQ